MNLCIDIGNTRIKYMIFDNENQQLFYHVEEEISELTVLAIQSYPIQNTMVCSTRNIDDQTKEKLSFGDFHLMTYETDLPISNKYLTPKTLGLDRLASACAVRSLFPNQTVIIINAGTCITSDLLDQSGNFLGGNISPGLHMRLKAMHHFTSKLPLVEMKYNENMIGQDTTSALQNGAVRGAIYELRAFIADIKSQYQHEVKVIVGGGDATIITKHLKIENIHVPNLVLIGLNEILKHSLLNKKGYPKG